MSTIDRTELTEEWNQFLSIVVGSVDANRFTVERVGEAKVGSDCAEFTLRFAVSSAFNLQNALHDLRAGVDLARSSCGEPGLVPDCYDPTKDWR